MILWFNRSYSWPFFAPSNTVSFKTPFPLSLSFHMAMLGQARYSQSSETVYLSRSSSAILGNKPFDNHSDYGCIGTERYLGEYNKILTIFFFRVMGPTRFLLLIIKTRINQALIIMCQAYVSTLHTLSHLILLKILC